MSHRIRLHFKSLCPQPLSENLQLQTLQTIYATYGIEASLLSAESLVIPEFNDRSYPGLNTGECRLNQPTSRQEKLFGKGSFASVKPGDIVVYFVQKLMLKGG